MGGKDHKKKVKQDNKDQQKAAHEKLQQDHHRAAIEEKKRERAARAAAPSAAAATSNDEGGSISGSSIKPPPTSKARTNRDATMDTDSESGGHATPRAGPSIIDLSESSEPISKEIKDMKEMIADFMTYQRGESATIRGYMAQQTVMYEALRTQFASEAAANDQRLTALEAKLATIGISKPDSPANPAALAKELDRRFDLLRSELKPVASTASPSWGDVAAAAPASSTRPSPPTATSGTSPPPFSSDADPCRIWVKGFRRDLMRHHLEAHYNLLADVMKDYLTNATPLLFAPRNAYSIKFQTKDDADRFLKASRELADDIIYWTDVYDGQVKKIKIDRDQSLASRNGTNAMSRLWDPTTKALKDIQTWSDEKMDRGDGVQIRVWRLVNKDRKLYIVHKGVPHALFFAHKITKDATEIGYFKETAKNFKIETFAASAASPL